LFPFILTALIAIHIILLHENKSNNPLGINAKTDQIPFGPYYTIKDLYFTIVFFIFFGFFVYFAPNVLGHPDNYIAANPMVTPTHIVPE
jgi:quinol-cytochrome oxidoreductase complex cytochrome b subunit